VPKNDERDKEDQELPQPLRAVLDTNVFVSGIISPSGPPGRILQALRRKEFVLVSSPAINEEILEVFTRPQLQKYHLQEALFDIAVILHVQADLIQEKTRVRISPDPDDDKFLAVAVDGQAQYVVTGDKSGLLQLGEYQSVRIVSSRLFLQLLRASRNVR
jgi:putative PIN family toxin of toxin-antitoxin system